MSELNQSATVSQLSNEATVLHPATRWAKTSLISGIACWVSFALAFLLPLLMSPLLMSAVATSTDGAGDSIPPFTAQIAIFISSVAMIGYPIGMALGLIGLVAGIVALRKVSSDQSAVTSKNMALAGAALGGISLLPTCFLLFGVGIWGALAIVMSSSGR